MHLINRLLYFQGAPTRMRIRRTSTSTEVCKQRNCQDLRSNEYGESQNLHKNKIKILKSKSRQLYYNVKLKFIIQDLKFSLLKPVQLVLIFSLLQLSLKFSLLQYSNFLKTIMMKCRLLIRIFLVSEILIVEWVQFNVLILSSLRTGLSDHALIDHVNVMLLGVGGLILWGRGEWFLGWRWNVAGSTIAILLTFLSLVLLGLRLRHSSLDMTIHWEHIIEMKGYCGSGKSREESGICTTVVYMVRQLQMQMHYQANEEQGDTKQCRLYISVSQATTVSSLLGYDGYNAQCDASYAPYEVHGHADQEHTGHLITPKCSTHVVLLFLGSLQYEGCAHTEAHSSNREGSAR